VDTKKKIVSNVYYYFLDFSMVGLIGYVFWIIMGKLLVPEQYGILLTIVSLFSVILPFTSFGFQESLPKFLPELSKRGKNKDARAMIAFSIKLTMIITLILSILFFIFSANISSFIYKSEKMILPLQIFSLLLFVGTLSYVSKAVLQGMQEFRHMFIADFYGTFIKIFLAAGLVFIGLQAIAGILGFVTWFFVTAIYYFLIILKFKPINHNFDKKNLYQFSIVSIVSLTLTYFLLQGGIFFVSFLSTLESAAMLGVAFVIGQFVLFLPFIIVGSIFPVLSELWYKNKKKFERVFSSAIKTLLIISLPITTSVIIFSDFIIKTLYTSAYLEAEPLIPTYMTATILFGINYFLLITLYSAYKAKTRLAILSIGSVVSLALFFLLIPIYEAHGAVFSFFTSQIIILGLSLYYLKKVINLNFSKRSALIIPLNILFLLILLSTLFTDIAVLKIGIFILSVSLYVILLFYLKILSKVDTEVLNYLPDRFGMRSVIKLLNKIANSFS